MDERELETTEDQGGIPRQCRRVRITLLATLLGLGLIGLWTTAWVASIRKDMLVVGQSTWVPALPFLAGDFKVHIDHVARLQAAGIDPYHKPDDWICNLYPYPPILGRSFGWVVLFDTFTAACVWQGALGLILAAGGIAAWRTRRELGISSIPPALIVALVLFSTPAVFAVERGQCDPMVILPIILAAWLLRRGAWAEIAAGSMLGVTAWLKYYPGLAVVALLALGKRKALACFMLVAVVIGLVDLDGVRESIKHGITTQRLMSSPSANVHPLKHSISEGWKALRFVRSSPPLRQIPGMVVAAVLLLPAIILVSRKVARSADPGVLHYPYLLWLASAATFGLPYSNDYNLATLPIATLAVWARRDKVIVHLAILASILWSQPFWLPIHGEFVLALKLGALYAVGASIAARATRVAEPIAAHAGSQLFRPAFARVVRSPSEVAAFSDSIVPGSRPS